jgi:hypothetical protein
MLSQLFEAFTIESLKILSFGASDALYSEFLQATKKIAKYFVYVFF